MAQHSGFFTALQNAAGEYDRTYRAEDYSSNLAVVISNGVLRSTDDSLKVTANGLNLTVNTGRGWAEGQWYYNDSPYSLPAVTPPTGGSRIDLVVLRFDNTLNVRAATIQYITGVAATTPVAPSLVRNDDIYDLCLAQITVNANATVVGVIDTRSNPDVCGWVYSVSGDNSFFVSLDNEFDEWFTTVKSTLASVTLFKQYRWTDTLDSATNTVQFNIPQYDEDTCFFNVYVNGLLAEDYTASGNVITFGTRLTAGTEITVLAYKSIDGTGIESVSDEITQLQNEVAALSGNYKYVYAATGYNDNISLSDIAQAFYAGSYDAANVTDAAEAFLEELGGNTYLAALASDAKITVEVVGKLGVTSPAYGTGSSTSRYRYFNLGIIALSSKRIIFDFEKAEKINISCEANTNNIIFYGSDLEIKNCAVKATGGSACPIQMIANSNCGRVNIDNCSFEIDTTGTSRIATHGTFTNCYVNINSSAGHALAFVPESEGLVRLIGGTYIATRGRTGSYTAAIIYTYATDPDAVAMAININCPAVTTAGYASEYLSVAYAGKTIIDMVVSTLTSTGNYNTITNQVQQDKSF